MVRRAAALPPPHQAAAWPTGRRPCCAAQPAVPLPYSRLCRFGYDLMFETWGMWRQMFWLGVPTEQDPTGPWVLTITLHSHASRALHLGQAAVYALDSQWLVSQPAAPGALDACTVTGKLSCPLHRAAQCVACRAPPRGGAPRCLRPSTPDPCAHALPAPHFQTCTCSKRCCGT